MPATSFSCSESLRYNPTGTAGRGIYAHSDSSLFITFPSLDSENVFILTDCLYSTSPNGQVTRKALFGLLKAFAV